MPTLSDAEILNAWEMGRNRPDWSRALIALEPAWPDAKPNELAALSVGERNRRLIELRRDVVGAVMHALVKCPACQGPFELEQRIDELLDGYAPPAARRFSFASGDYAAECRLLTSEDLAHAAAQEDERRTRLALIDRALLSVTRGGEAIKLDDLPAEVVDLLARQMAERDPLSLIRVPLTCAACGHVWAATLQIVPFLWTELECQAKRIIEDIVALARFYGWSEDEILALSRARREYYLDAIGT